jgi:hypothetical protein
MKDKPKKPEQDQSAEVVDPQDVIAVSQEQGDGFRDRRKGDVLKEGQFAVFRWSDADQYDPEGAQWFVGIILEVCYPDKEELEDVEQDKDGCCPNCGERVEYPSYRVLCEDGIERSFMDHEEYYPNSEWSEEEREWVPGEDAWMVH